MATYNLRRFCKPSVLDAVNRPLLLRFLSRFDAILAKQGIQLTSPEELPMDRLVVAFLNPDLEDPGLADALYVIDEMATRHGMQELLEIAEGANLAWDGAEPPTEADIAIWLWVERRDLFEETHAQMLATSRRAFQTYFPISPPPFAPPDDGTLARLASSLDVSFEKKHHGRGCHIFSGGDNGKCWFMVRHGEPYKREKTNDDGVRSTVVYRPEAYDVITYRPASGELAINTGSKWEVELYRKAFGEHLFGDIHVDFSEEGRYNLDPIRRDGKDCLECGDVAGIESIRLRELRFLWGGSLREVEIRQALDLFEVYDGKNRQLPPAEIAYAKFEVWFEDAKTARVLSIDPPETAGYTRDGDAEVLEEWMTLRGFVRSGEEA